MFWLGSSSHRFKWRFFPLISFIEFFPFPPSTKNTKLFLLPKSFFLYRHFVAKRKMSLCPKLSGKKVIDSLLSLIFSELCSSPKARTLKFIFILLDCSNWEFYLDPRFACFVVLFCAFFKHKLNFLLLYAQWHCFECCSFFWEKVRQEIKYCFGKFKRFQEGNDV